MPISSRIGFRHASSLVCGGQSGELILVDGGDFGNDVDAHFRSDHRRKRRGRWSGQPGFRCRYLPCRCLEFGPERIDI